MVTILFNWEIIDLLKKFKRSIKRSKGVNLYSNLAARRRGSADSRSRRKAEYLATLPKHPVKRFFYRMSPKRAVKYWFSRDGAVMLLKLGGVGVLVIGILFVALFAFYRKELDAIRPGELSKRVQSTVTKYYDRNNVLLWDDKGDGDYKLVIESQAIPKVMKEATIAVEDQDFYKHSGISFQGLFRASINNFTGGEVQGASTLTQQLIKNVFFQEESQQNRISISRKIKEIILALEVERMYNKDQILTMYLNEVPYGGRRNGVESAALTYFGKKTKDLSLAQAALIASIPQNPSYYNPYYLEGNKDLIARQQFVLDKMEQQGYATKEQVEKAKKVPILDQLKPELSGLRDIKAPHFVLQVRNELEKELGTKVVRGGGLIVKTTLDYRVQKLAEEVVKKNKDKIFANGGDNTAITAIDAPTGQILAMVGSYDFHNKSYGSVNAATSMLQPGSSIKPFIFANLFKERKGQNWGPGSILSDDPVPQSIYKTADGTSLQNFDNRFYGTMTIRQALANSRNTSAVKAGYIGGIDEAIKTAREAGDRSYCTTEVYGLSAAIGSCTLKQVEHVNAYATFARQGVYKKEAYALEVKNTQGQILKQWKDESKRVLDSQIAYLISDILSDANARTRVFGVGHLGFTPAGVKTAIKTGTTDDGKGHIKENWAMTYTPKLAVGIWTGRHDGKPLNFYSTAANDHIIDEFMSRSHKEIFEKDKTWKPNDWFTKPAGIQTLTINGRTDIFPSWFKKPKNAEGVKMMFDKVSKKKATECTPNAAKVELTVQVMEDAITKKKTYSAPDGYDANKDDDIHHCGDKLPTVTSIDVGACTSGSPCTITINVNKGKFKLSSIEVSVDGKKIATIGASNSGSYNTSHSFSVDSHTISAVVSDTALYTGSANKTINVLVNNKPPGRRHWWDS